MNHCVSSTPDGLRPMSNGFMYLPWPTLSACPPMAWATRTHSPFGSLMMMMWRP